MAVHLGFCMIWLRFIHGIVPFRDMCMCLMRKFTFTAGYSLSNALKYDDFCLSGIVYNAILNDLLISEDRILCRSVLLEEAISFMVRDLIKTRDWITISHSSPCAHTLLSIMNGPRWTACLRECSFTIGGRGMGRNLRKS